MNKISQIILSASLLTCSSSYAADANTTTTQNNFYVGGAVGIATADISSSDIPDNYSLDDSDTSLKFFVGYKLSDNFSIEGGYIDLGEMSISNSYTESLVNFNEKTIAESNAFIVNIKGHYALSDSASVYAKVGVASWDIEGTEKFTATIPSQNISQSYSEDVYDESGTDVFFGVGIGFDLGDFQLFGEYEKFKIDDENVDVLSIGATYYF